MNQRAKHRGKDAIIVLILAVALAFFSLSAVAGNDVNNEPIATLSKKEVKRLSEEQSQERVLILEQRLEEINHIEKETLSRTNRKALRKEVKDIRQELKLHNGIGIYIGGGTLLLVIILLIILL